MSVLQGELSKRAYLLGDAFTAADLYIGSHLGFGMRFGMIDQMPEFEAYVARLMARPAAQRATEKDGPMPPR